MFRIARTRHHRDFPSQLLPLAWLCREGERVHVHNIEEFAAHSGYHVARLESACPSDLVLRSLRRARVPVFVSLRPGDEI